MFKFKNPKRVIGGYKGRYIARPVNLIIGGFYLTILPFLAMYYLTVFPVFWILKKIYHKCKSKA